MDRKKEISSDEPLGHLMWSDPEEQIEEWRFSARGGGYFWGQTSTEKFLHHNKLDHIARAHQLQQTGYSTNHGGKVITVFSAPNYCYRCGNEAAIMLVNENLQKTYL